MVHALLPRRNKVNLTFIVNGGCVGRKTTGYKKPWRYLKILNYTEKLLHEGHKMQIKPSWNGKEANAAVQGHFAESRFEWN